MYTIFKPLSLARKSDNTKVPVGSDIYTSLVLFGKLITSGQDIRFFNVDPDSKTLYTVPAGKYFFLIGASLCMQHDSFNRDDEVFITGGSDATGEINNSCILRIQMGNHGGAGTITTLSETINPTIPLRYSPGDKIILRNDNYHASAAGSIQGYEIDIALLKNILE